MSIYLDNSATTPICENAKKKMLLAMDELWGNPSSFHKKGVEALSLLDEARKTVAEKLGADSEEIYFTSGGTLSNNIAVFGAAKAGARKGGRIVTTAVEHPSVDRAMKALENSGFEIVRLKVDENCAVSKKDILDAIDEKTVLVSMMLVNNEVGAIMPVEFLKKAVKAKNSPALIHCDAVQAFGKTDVDVKKLGVDLLTVSSHKINGPKGAGALYIRKGVRIVSPVAGGGQEGDVCPGTQATPAIAGFFGAAEEIGKKTFEQLEAIREIKNEFVERLSKIESVTINSPADSLPYIVNFSVQGIPSQPMITFLSQNGVCVSGGSACAKGHRSPTLTAMGLSVEKIDSAIRVSMSKNTTRQELEKTAELVEQAVKTMRKSR
ncbi:MAG: cysteine desulfurase [Clostridia bacterium]|nr:cysteine desulfurase [Clostridia bacterium]